MSNEMPERKPDIFDRLMHLPGLRVFEPFYRKHKEVLMYLLFGGLAFFLNMFLFWLFTEPVGMNELVANVFCWIICVTFQYITNKTWVFDGRTYGWKNFWRQFFAFYAARLGTLAMEEAILLVFITLMHLPDMPVKLFAQVVVIVFNYVFSKLFVFKGKDQKSREKRESV
ncbi:MAG: GtrA family protein [Lachnospiraceae bacterium]|nr:GtrA family protein [Lachnospiraceae bacterium]